jgi:periplasmic divalent cation tolerance protein
VNDKAEIQFHEPSDLHGLMDVFEVTTTVELLADANRLASELISKRLAACVQITGPIHSVYEWNNLIQSGQEYSMKLKVSPRGVASAIAFLKSNHPYTLPELIVNQVKASSEYANWVDQQTSGEKQSLSCF